jgi:hypothetical protein
MPKKWPGGKRTPTETELRELQLIIDQSPYKTLTSGDLVQAAENPQSAFHGYFTWDNDEAGHQYRLEEARRLIKSYTIYQPDIKAEVQIFTSLDMDRIMGRGYRWTMDAAQDTDLRTELVYTTLKQLMSLESKYRHIVELASIWGAIEETADRLGVGKTPEPQPTPKPKRARRKEVQAAAEMPDPALFVVHDVD